MLSKIEKVTVQYAFGDTNLAIKRSLELGIPPGSVAIAARGLQLGVDLLKED